MIRAKPGRALLEPGSFDINFLFVFLDNICILFQEKFECGVMNFAKSWIKFLLTSFLRPSVRSLMVHDLIFIVCED